MIVFTVRRYVYCVFVSMSMFNCVYPMSFPCGIDSNDFESFYTMCQMLPRYEMGRANPCSCAITMEQLHGALLSFFNELNRSSLIASERWVANSEQVHDACAMMPYVQKIIIPAEGIIAIHGDLHGDIHSLSDYILYLQEKGYLEKDNAWKIKDPEKFYMCFLGDYVDRGWYGAEVLYTLLKLKRSNPENVWLLRGNHESDDICSRYGFYSELEGKFCDTRDLKEQISHLFNALPVAVFCGSPESDSKCNFVQCCHGGMEIGFDPQELLNHTTSPAYALLGDYGDKRCSEIDALFSGADLSGFDEEKENMKTLLKKYNQIGFSWGDFNVEGRSDKLLGEVYGRGVLFGERLTKALLAKMSTSRNVVHAVLRGHQHVEDDEDAMMRDILNRDQQRPKEDTGISKLWLSETMPKRSGAIWPGMVGTHLVAPGTSYGKGAHFNYDACVLLKTAQRFEDWQLNVVRLLCGTEVT